MPDRIIKQSICESDSIDRLTWFQEALFYRLIVHCDDRGRFDARPRIVRGLLFPLKDDMPLSEIVDGLRGLEVAGLIKIYGGGRYLYMPTWSKHQRIRNVRAKYPDPEGVEDSCGDLPQSAAECGDLQQSAASRARAESNPIQSKSYGRRRSLDSNKPGSTPLEATSSNATVEVLPEDEFNPFGENPVHAPSDTVEVYIANHLQSALTPGHIDQLTKLQDDGMSDGAIKLAIDIVAGGPLSGRTWNHTYTILRRWAEAGVKTLGEAQAAEEEFVAARSSARGYQQRRGGMDDAKRVGGIAGAATSDQGTYDDAEIERISNL